MILRGRGGRSAKKCTVLHSTEGPFAVLHDHGVPQTDLQYRGCTLTCGAFQGRPSVIVTAAVTQRSESLHSWLTCVCAQLIMSSASDQGVSLTRRCHQGDEVIIDSLMSLHAAAQPVVFTNHSESLAPAAQAAGLALPP